MSENLDLYFSFIVSCCYFVLNFGYDFYVKNLHHNKFMCSFDDENVQKKRCMYF